MVKYLIYPIIKCSLDQVPPIRVLQSFWNYLSSLQFEGWMMNVCIWRTSFSYPVPLEEERSRTLESGIGSYCFVIRQRLWYPMKSIRFQNGLLWRVFLYYIENLFCVQPRLGMAWRSCVEVMPCNSDLYVYLNIEVVIGLVQWSPFLRNQVVL